MVISVSNKQAIQSNILTRLQRKTLAKLRKSWSFFLSASEFSTKHSDRKNKG